MILGSNPGRSAKSTRCPYTGVAIWCFLLYAGCMKKDAIFELRAKGYSYSQIQAATGASKGTIAYHLGAGVKEKTQKRRVMTRGTIDGFIQHFKETNPCHDCDRFYPYYILQFDHLPQFEKLFAISKYHNFTNDLKVVIAEMQKCELVCGNCHAARGHYRRLDSKGMLMDEEE